jgi:hypothetical protein
MNTQTDPSQANSPAQEEPPPRASLPAIRRLSLDLNIPGTLQPLTRLLPGGEEGR